LTTEGVIRMVAGTLVLASLGLGVEQSPIFAAREWLWVTVFVGANLLQSSFTRFCPLELVLRKAGVRQA
jgi:hypothetical protein